MARPRSGRTWSWSLWPLLALVAGLGACGSPSPPVETGPVLPPPPPPVEVLQHPVQAGETLARIADLYYGDPGRAGELAAVNGVGVNARLAPGSVLRIPLERDEVAEVRRRQAALAPYNRGVAAMEQGDFEAAERQFRLALRTAPGMERASYNLALVLIKRGRHEGAAEMLAPLVATRPDEADYGFALGNALFHQTRYDEAAVAFADVLARHPDHRRSAFGHARALQEAGRREEALAAWDAYLTLDPDSPWAAEARRLRSRLLGR
ncbi:tetratricopeptide repeat protein [bacterium]|nr:tetratricopeptide repeat protein [bacterium]